MDYLLQLLKGMAMPEICCHVILVLGFDLSALEN